MKIHNYKFYCNEDGYITACCAVLNEDYDFTGQMSEHKDVLESFGYGGWFKFEDGKFVLDEERKALKLKEYEERLNENK